MILVLTRVSVSSLIRKYFKTLYHSVFPGYMHFSFLQFHMRIDHDSLHVVGGMLSDEYYADTAEMFNIAEMKWDDGNRLPIPIVSASLTVNIDGILISNIVILG